MIRLNQTRSILAGLACAAAPLATTATCNPYRGTLDLFRYDDYVDTYYVDGVVYYDEYYYDDCFFFDCF